MEIVRQWFLKSCPFMCFRVSWMELICGRTIKTWNMYLDGDWVDHSRVQLGPPSTVKGQGHLSYAHTIRVCSSTHMVRVGASCQVAESVEGYSSPKSMESRGQIFYSHATGTIYSRRSWSAFLLMKSARSRTSYLIPRAPGAALPGPLGISWPWTPWETLA